MIRNKLSILLAERGIKATKVANDTGIARSTLSKITNNSSEKIDYSTINTLCRYLKITPCDFFEYEPFDVSFFVSLEKTYTEDNVLFYYDIEAFMNIYDADGKHTIEYTGVFELDGKGYFAFYVEPASNDDVILVDMYLHDVSQTFITDITTKFKTKIIHAANETGNYDISMNDHITINLFDKKKTS